MDELKKQLQEKFGLDDNATEGAIKMVLDFVKDKLPENLQGSIDAIAKGEMPDMGGGALDAVKGLFGK